MSTTVYITSTDARRRILQCSETTLRRWRKLPNFPRPIRTTTGPSGHLRWVEAELIDWLESMREVSA